jgi:hypothetical protein
MAKATDPARDWEVVAGSGGEFLELTAKTSCVTP